VIAAVPAGGYVLLRAAAEVYAGGAPPNPDPTPAYTLTPPRTVEDGGPTLSGDLSDTFQRVTGPGPTAVAGRHDDGSGDEELPYLGHHGDTGGSEAPEERPLDDTEGASSLSVAVPRRDVTPADSGEPLTCEVLIRSEDGEEHTIPLCARSDAGAMGSVADNSLDAFAHAPEDVDLDAFAERVSGIRDEVCGPVGRPRPLSAAGPADRAGRRRGWW